MNSSLLIAAVSTWVFWSCLFAVRQRVEQMYATGVGSGDTSFLKIITLANGTVLLNFVVFLTIIQLGMPKCSASFNGTSGYVLRLASSWHARRCSGPLGAGVTASRPNKSFKPNPLRGSA